MNPKWMFRIEIFLRISYRGIRNFIKSQFVFYSVVIYGSFNCVLFSNDDKVQGFCYILPKKLNIFYQAPLFRYHHNLIILGYYNSQNHIMWWSEWVLKVKLKYLSDQRIINLLWKHDKLPHVCLHFRVGNQILLYNIPTY